MVGILGARTLASSYESLATERITLVWQSCDYCPIAGDKAFCLAQRHNQCQR